jgi:uncharacterized protein (TIGR02246 family)
MDDVRRLIALEEIKALMARRVRCLDEKDWAGFAACYTDDAVCYSFTSADAPEDTVIGGQAIAERVAATLAEVTTVHQLHTPELEILSEDRATGIWPLNDILIRVQDGQRRWMRAYGHYRQTYRKEGGRWLIAEHRLTRLLMETGVGDVGA